MAGEVGRSLQLGILHRPRPLGYNPCNVASKSRSTSVHVTGRALARLKGEW